MRAYEKRKLAVEKRLGQMRGITTKYHRRAAHGSRCGPLGALFDAQWLPRTGVGAVSAMASITSACQPTNNTLTSTTSSIVG